MSGSAASSELLPVALDTMGGDFGCGVVVEGAVDALRQLNIPSILVGDEDQIRAHLKRLDADNDPALRVHHTSQAITMEDSPAKAIRSKKDASIGIAFELVRDGRACGVVSPGNTGAMMAAGLFVSGTMPGIARPAIASLVPRVGDVPPTILLDAGANVDCHAYQLVQFALMGDLYARYAMACDRPRVALLSNGTESSKGNDILRSAAMILSEMSGLNFIGYVEGRDVVRNAADVIVCDGFVGNIVLKTIEGSAGLVVDSIRGHVERSWRGRLGMWLVNPGFRSLFRDKLDPSFYGGAPLLGLNHIAIVCHGSSKGRAIMNGVRVAQKLHEQRLLEHMRQALSALDSERAGDFENGIWDRMESRFAKRRGKNAGAKGQAVSPQADQLGVYKQED